MTTPNTTIAGHHSYSMGYIIMCPIGCQTVTDIDGISWSRMYSDDDDTSGQKPNLPVGNYEFRLLRICT